MAKIEYWKETSDPVQLQLYEDDELSKRVTADLVIDNQPVVVRGELIDALRRSTYNPIEGGHAPRELHRCFSRAMLVMAFDSPSRKKSDVPYPRYRGIEVYPDDMLAVLWNCTDPLPQHLVLAFPARLGVQLPSFAEWTYGNAARALWACRHPWVDMK